MRSGASFDLVAQDEFGSGVAGPWRSPPGWWTERCFQRHTNVEFLAFLKQVARAYSRVELHVICDNYGIHKHPTSKRGWPSTPRCTCTSPRPAGAG